MRAAATAAEAVLHTAEAEKAEADRRARTLRELEAAVAGFHRRPNLETRTISANVNWSAGAASSPTPSWDWDRHSRTDPNSPATGAQVA